MHRRPYTQVPVWLLPSAVAVAKSRLLEKKAWQIPEPCNSTTPPHVLLVTNANATDVVTVYAMIYALRNAVDSMVVYHALGCSSREKRILFQVSFHLKRAL